MYLIFRNGSLSHFIQEIKLQEGDISFFNKALVDIDENAAEVGGEQNWNLFRISLVFVANILKWISEDCLPLPCQISKELKMFPRRFEFLIRTAANLYSDSLKFQGGVLKVC